MGVILYTYKSHQKITTTNFTRLRNYRNHFQWMRDNIWHRSDEWHGRQQYIVFKIDWKSWYKYLQLQENWLWKLMKFILNLNIIDDSCKTIINQFLNLGVTIPLGRPDVQTLGTAHNHEQSTKRCYSTRWIYLVLYHVYSYVFIDQRQNQN